MKAINASKFFPIVRNAVFPHRLTQEQVNGMNAIIKAWDSSMFTDLRWLSYMFATTFHETGGRMVPISEFGGYDYCERMYGPNAELRARACTEARRRCGRADRCPMRYLLLMLACLLPTVAAAQEQQNPTVGDRVIAEYQQRLADAERRAIINGSLAADLESRLKWVLDNWVPKSEDKK